MQLCHILGQFKQIFVSSSSNSSTERIKATIVSSIKSKMDSVPCRTEIRASRCNRGSCRVQYQFDSEQREAPAFVFVRPENQPCRVLLHAHRGCQQSSKIFACYTREDVRDYDYFTVRPHRLVSRTAPPTSTTSRIHLRLVDFSPNRRGSITDRHGFVDTRPRINLSHLFQ
jgi:hypothetical protein